MNPTRRAFQTAPQWLRRAAGPVGVVVLAALLSLMVLHLSGFNLQLLSTGYIGFGGDSLLNSWSIYQAMENLARRPLDLGYSPIFYGDPEPFAYTIAPYGIALVVWPVYLLSGGNLVLTYNLYLIATFPLTALMAYLLCRHLTGAARPIAAVAGLMMAFAQPRMLHLAHVEQLSTHLLLLVLYCLHRLIDTPRIRWAAGLAAAFWLTFLTSGYLAMTGVIAGAIVLIYVLVRYPGAYHRRRVALLLGAAGLAILLMAPFLLFRLRNPVVAAGRSYEEIVHYSAPLESFAAGTSLLYSDVTPPIDERLYLFLGFVPIGLSLAAWHLRKTPPATDPGQPERLLTGYDVVVVYGIMTLTGFVLAVGPVLQAGGNRIAPMPYLLIMQLPGFSALRVAARFFFLAVTGTTVLSAFALDRWGSKLSRPATWLATAAVCGALAIELFPLTGSCSHRLDLAFDGSCGSPPLAAFVPAAEPPIYRWLAQQPPDTPVMHYPMTGPQAYEYYAYLPSQGQPMLNGEGASFVPDWFQQTDWDEFPDLRTIVFLKQRGIRYAVVHHNLLTPAEEVRLLTQMARYEADWEKIPLVKQFGNVSAYEVDITPRQRLRIEFDEGLPGAGWSGPETGNDKTFQWMGNEATLILPLAQGAPLTIRVQTYLALQDESLQQLRLWVNGRLVRLDSRETDEGTVIFEGTIPQEALGPQETLSVLKFVTQGAIRPSDLGEGSDVRLLAVAVDWLEIQPAESGDQVR